MPIDRWLRQGGEGPGPPWGRLVGFASPTLSSPRGGCGAQRDFGGHHAKVPSHPALETQWTRTTDFSSPCLPFLHPSSVSPVPSFPPSPSLPPLPSLPLFTLTPSLLPPCPLSSPHLSLSIPILSSFLSFLVPSFFLSAFRVSPPLPCLTPSTGHLMCRRGIHTATSWGWNSVA